MIIRTVATAALVALSPAMPASAQPETIGSLTLVDTWARATPPNAPTAGGYLAITNSGDEADRLVAVASPAAKTVQIHVMEVRDGVMSMHEAEGGVAIPPGETVTLAPGGFHLMFMGLSQAFKEGDTVPITLRFEHAGSVDTLLAVQPIGAKGPPMMTHNHGDAP